MQPAAARILKPVQFNERLVQEYGYAGVAEFCDLLRKVPRETPQQRQALSEWLSGNCTKAGLLRLIGE